VRYASLTHPTNLYLHNQETVSAYLADWLAWSHQMRKKTARKSATIYWKTTSIEGKKTSKSYGRTSVLPY